MCRYMLNHVYHGKICYYFHKISVFEKTFVHSSLSITVLFFQWDVLFPMLQIEALNTQTTKRIHILSTIIMNWTPHKIVQELHQHHAPIHLHPVYLWPLHQFMLRHIDHHVPKNRTLYTQQMLMVMAWLHAIFNLVSMATWCRQPITVLLQEGIPSQRPVTLLLVLAHKYHALLTKRIHTIISTGLTNSTTWAVKRKH